jgi:hypothetical protein
MVSSKTATLRQSVKRSISNVSSDLLGSEGLADRQQNIEKEVPKITKNQSDNLLNRGALLFRGRRREEVPRQNIANVALKLPYIVSNSIQ